MRGRLSALLLQQGSDPDADRRIAGWAWEQLMEMTIPPEQCCNHRPTGALKHSKHTLKGKAEGAKSSPTRENRLKSPS
jgi:hypothetical protein